MKRGGFTAEEGGEGGGAEGYLALGLLKNRLRQAANDMFTKRIIKNALQKAFLAITCPDPSGKPLRHKGKMRSIFSASCL